MSGADADPYAALGVSKDVTEAELRRAYRALVKLHHPDHNGGSPESAIRFARIQEAYSELSRRRAGSSQAAAESSQRGAAGSQPGADPDLEHRIRSMEQEIAALNEEKRRRDRERDKQAAVQAAAQAARQRAAYEAVAAAGRRPTPEELGNYSTADSFTQIIDDAAEQLGQRLRSAEAEGKRQFARRLTDLFSDEK